MALFDGLVKVHFVLVGGVSAFGGAGRHGVLEEFLDFLMNGCVVALEGQHVVGALADDVGGDVFLAPMASRVTTAPLRFKAVKELGGRRLSRWISRSP